MHVALKKQKRRFSLPRFLTDIHSTFYFYIFLLVIGVIFFASSIFTNYFTTPLTGDYTSQQYAFYINGYDDWWHFLTTGEFVLYDTNTYFGASNIGSNSFYYLFDPFFLPILLCPRILIPQGMAILTIIKMALAGLTMMWYLKYIGISNKTSRIAGFAYAFSGWITWYLWFNHFTGTLVMFPVILMGVEKILKEKKPWLCAFGLMMLGFSNFFFFFTFVVCAFLYAGFRYFQKIKTRNAKDNLAIVGVGFVGFLMGCLLPCMVVIPSTIVALHAPRASSSTYLNILIEALKTNDWGTLVYKAFNWNAENMSGNPSGFRHLYPILDFIFPAMTNRGTPLVKLGNESYDNVAGSLFCYSPFIILFVPAIINSVRNKKWSHLIAIAVFILMLFTPIAYYAFHGFTNAYSRWTLFVTTSLITYVAFYIDEMHNKPRWHIFFGAAFALILAWVSVGLAIWIANSYDSFKLRYAYVEMGDYGFLFLEGALLTLYVLAFTVIVYFYGNKKKLYTICMTAIAIEAATMGALTLNGHGFEKYENVNNGYTNNEVFQDVINQIKRDDPTYYRCYSSQSNASARNDSMRHDYNGLGMFHSIYNYNISNFLNWSNVNGGYAPDSWSGSYVEKRLNMDTFLGIKYYFINKDVAFWGNKKAQDLKAKDYHPNAPLNFVDISDKYPNDKYYVFENKNFVDFAYSFDQVLYYNENHNRSLYGKVIENEELYLRYALMQEKDLSYVDKSLLKENITNIDGASLDFDIKAIKPNQIKYQYYDIHKDAETDRTDASSYNFASNLLDLSKYTEVFDRPATWKYNGRYVTVITPDEGFPYDENGLALYLRSNYQSEYNINLYLAIKDENGNDRFYTFDNHNDAKLSGNYNWKNYRGVYLVPTYDENGNIIKKAPELSKIIIAHRKTKNMGYSSKDADLYFDTATNINARIANLKENGVTDVTYKTNKFTFKTNYNSKRVVVTQLPYEDGWTVKAKNSSGKTRNLEVFTAQGGFVSFVGEIGETEYELEFYTPYLKLGSYLSAIGVFLYGATLISYLYIDLIAKEKKQIKNLALSR